jgi:hypothetical protein
MAANKTTFLELGHVERITLPLLFQTIETNPKDIGFDRMDLVCLDETKDLALRMGGSESDHAWSDHLHRLAAPRTVSFLHQARGPNNYDLFFFKRDLGFAHIRKNSLPQIFDWG